MYPSYHTLQSRYEWGDLLSQISWSRLAASLGCVMWCFFLASRLAICWRFVGRWGHGFNLKWQERPSHDSSIEVSAPVTPKLSVRFYPWMDGDYVEKIDVGRPLSHTITAGDADGLCQYWPVWSARECGPPNFVVTFISGPLHTWAKSRVHDIVRAQTKVFESRPNTPSKIM